MFYDITFPESWITRINVYSGVGTLFPFLTFEWWEDGVQSAVRTSCRFDLLKYGDSARNVAAYYLDSVPGSFDTIDDIQRQLQEMGIGRG